VLILYELNESDADGPDWFRLMVVKRSHCRATSFLRGQAKDDYSKPKRDCRPFIHFASRKAVAKVPAWIGVVFPGAKRQPLTATALPEQFTGLDLVW